MKKIPFYIISLLCITLLNAEIAHAENNNTGTQSNTNSAQENINSDAQNKGEKTISDTRDEFLEIRKQVEESSEEASEENKNKLFVAGKEFLEKIYETSITSLENVASNVKGDTTIDAEKKQVLLDSLAIKIESLKSTQARIEQAESYDRIEEHASQIAAAVQETQNELYISKLENIHEKLAAHIQKTENVIGLLKKDITQLKERGSDITECETLLQEYQTALDEHKVLLSQLQTTILDLRSGAKTRQEAEKIVLQVKESCTRVTNAFRAMMQEMQEYYQTRQRENENMNVNQ